jgi:hypothetical protein
VESRLKTPQPTEGRGPETPGRRRTFRVKRVATARSLGDPAGRKEETQLVTTAGTGSRHEGARSPLRRLGPPIRAAGSSGLAQLGRRPLDFGLEFAASFRQERGHPRASASPRARRARPAARRGAPQAPRPCSQGHRLQGLEQLVLIKDGWEGAGQRGRSSPQGSRPSRSPQAWRRIGTSPRFRRPAWVSTA